MAQPIALPNYARMMIGSHEETIEEHNMMQALLIICLTVVAGCDTRLQEVNCCDGEDDGG